MAYKFSELNKLGDKFMTVFGIGFKPFYDGLMSVASKQLCIDILKFDEWLHKKHGNYEDAGQSMDDCIREHYGDEGARLINEVNGSMKLRARITFVTDKMVKNLKKCLDKRDLATFAQYPAIEPETGLMIATDGHILAVTKLKDYRCELGEGVLVVNGTRMLPVEVLGMNGTVTIEIMGDGQGNETVRVSDEKDTAAEMEQKIRYPNWRSVMPWKAGWAIDVDAKAWGSSLNAMIKAMDKNEAAPQYSVRLYGERGDKTLCMSHYDWGDDEVMKQDLDVVQMPYKMFATFAGKKLQAILAFEPTAMRFAENTMPVMFYSADTLMLLMPLLVNDGSGMVCKVESKDCDCFDMEKWLHGEAQGVSKPKPKAKTTKAARSAAEHQPSFAERLRDALLKHYKAAA